MKSIIITLITILVGATTLNAQQLKATEAAKKVGETVTVCDKIFGGKYFETSSKITLLNMGAAFPKSPLTIVIKAEDRKNFAEAPEKYYNNKKVCVTGVITVYNEKPQIVISTPNEIAEEKK